MEETEKVESSPIEQPTQTEPPKRKLRSFKKCLYYLLAVLVILAVFFVPVKGKSLFNRLLELRKEKVVNLAPNPGFEEGSGDKPAGWTTKSGE